LLDEGQVERYKDELIQIRRLFHRYPELANEETKTAEYVEEYLKNCGLKVVTGLAGTGLIGILKGSDGPTIAFRTDMDALPIEEENDVSYHSLHPNIMHACGHDGHLAVTLVTAKILSTMKDKIKGNVIFIFQPAEEDLPEGGAKRLIEDGKKILSSVDAIFGFHFWPSLPTGVVAASDEAMMAAGDIFEVYFSGKGSHGANPHESSDVLMMVCDAVLSLTGITLREIEPGIQATVSVGAIKGGESANVLPSNAFIKGTTRYVHDFLKKKFPETIERVLEGICKSYNGGFKMDYQYGYPILKNNPKMAGLVRESAKSVRSVSKVIHDPNPALACEDFARFLEKIPGSYFWVGTQNSNDGIENHLHSPRFDLDESALVIAVEVYLSICSKFILE